jgi:hypothetical protein
MVGTSQIFTLMKYTFINTYYYLFSLALQPSAGYGLLVTRGFLITHNDAPQSVGRLIRSSQKLYLTTHNTQTSMPPVGFEPTIPAGEWP